MTTTATREPGQPRTSRRPESTFHNLLTRFAQWLTQHSIAALRISLGLVIAGFGVLKFFPGASPAEDLVMRTTEALTFGVVSGTTAVVLTAVLETFLGLVLLTGRGLRLGLVVMVGWFVGIMAPLVLFTGEMFPGGGPSLEAQYILKNIILAAAWGVIAARTLGARLTLTNNTNHNAAP